MTEQTPAESTYLGDGVEAEFDGWHVILTVDRTKVAMLNPSVWTAVVRYGVKQGFEIPEDVR